MSDSVLRGRPRWTAIVTGVAKWPQPLSGPHADEQSQQLRVAQPPDRPTVEVRHGEGDLDVGGG